MLGCCRSSQSGCCGRVLQRQLSGVHSRLQLPGCYCPWLRPQTACFSSYAAARVSTTNTRSTPTPFPFTYSSSCLLPHHITRSATAPITPRPTSGTSTTQPSPAAPAAEQPPPPFLSTNQLRDSFVFPADSHGTERNTAAVEVDLSDNTARATASHADVVFLSSTSASSEQHHDQPASSAHSSHSATDLDSCSDAAHSACQHNHHNHHDHAHPHQHSHTHSHSHSHHQEHNHPVPHSHAQPTSTLIPSSPPILPGWHQRPLPSTLTPFSSPRGRQLFRSALSQQLLEAYFPLSEQFTTQSEPAYCGPSTLAMVLNALRIDPRRVWKGNWRWFSEEMLETCDVRRVGRAALEGVEVNGLSFEEMLLLAECNGASVQAFRASQSSLSKFRTAVHTAASQPGIHLVASFSRAVMGQTGCGHYSPIAGYHPQTDMALVMDVARFKYPPYWAPVSLLWRAIQEIDPLTGQGRGYYLMSRSEAEGKGEVEGEVGGETECYVPLSSTARIALDKQAWARLAEHFCSFLPQQLAATQPSSPYAVFVTLLSSLPVDVTAIFTVYTHELRKRYERKTVSAEATATTAASEEKTADSSFNAYSSFIPAETPHRHVQHRPTHHSLHSLLSAISSTPLFQLLSSPPPSPSPLSLDLAHPHAPSTILNLIGGLGTVSDRQAELELATLLLFACPASIFSLLPAALQAQIAELRRYEGGGELGVEIGNVRRVMGILAEACECRMDAEREAERRRKLQEESGTDKPTNETVVSPVTQHRFVEAERAVEGDGSVEQDEWAEDGYVSATDKSHSPRHRFASNEQQ